MTTIGFVGLGVIGEPMCRNLATKSGARVLAFDRRADPLARLAADGVEAAGSLGALAEQSAIVFLSLPGGPEVEAVCDGLLAAAGPGKTVVDASTTPVDTTRALAARFAEVGADYADAPVARTREAAVDGTLSVMVGADAAVFARIEPWLAFCASDVTHCGGVGCGQVVKLMNNMVLFETVVALSEALSVARRAGVDGRVLLDTLAKGSADSFALRNHGMRAMLPGVFPEQAFSTDYARKDLDYALRLAAEHGVDVPGANTAQALLERASAAGYGDLYFPSLLRVLDGGPA